MFHLSPVSCTDIKRIIMSMPSNKTPGPDKVSMSVLKDCLPVVLGPITNIINCSFATSTFPDDMKLAEVIPLLKDGDHEVASNNRRLSLLNTVSKICERAVLNQFNSYLTRNKRLSVQQSNIGAFCLRMRENCSVRLQMADLLGGCEFCHGFYEKYGLNFCSISLNSC